MASFNRVQLIGNLGQDPELRYTQSQTPLTNISVATTEFRNTPEGGKQALPTGIGSLSGDGRRRTAASTCTKAVLSSSKDVCKRVRGKIRADRNATPLRWWHLTCSFSAASLLKPKMALELMHLQHLKHTKPRVLLLTQVTAMAAVLTTCLSSHRAGRTDCARQVTDAARQACRRRAVLG